MSDKMQLPNQAAVHVYHQGTIVLVCCAYVVLTERCLFVQSVKNQHITPHLVPPKHLSQIRQHDTHCRRDRDPRSADTTETEARDNLLRPN